MRYLFKVVFDVDESQGDSGSAYDAAREALKQIEALPEAEVSGAWLYDPVLKSSVEIDNSGPIQVD